MGSNQFCTNSVPLYVHVPVETITSFALKHTPFISKIIKNNLEFWGAQAPNFVGEGKENGHAKLRN